MKVFDFKSGSVVLTAEILLIKEFDDLWKRDKKRCLQELKYIYLAYSHDSDNPYRHYEDSLKIERAEQDVFQKKYKPDSLVKKAIEKFIEIQESSISMRLYIAAKKALDKVISYLDTVDFSLLDNNGKPIYDINKLTKTLEGTGSLLKSLKDLEDRVRMEQFDTSKTKKDRSVNYFEQ